MIDYSDEAPAHTHTKVAIFWDYENCEAPKTSDVYEVTQNIVSFASRYGYVSCFKAYTAAHDRLSAVTLRRRCDLPPCGISVTGTPNLRHGGKDSADKMLIMDMLTYAWDHPGPCTMILISGDRDFARLTSVMQLRGYPVVVVGPPDAHPSLIEQAHQAYQWPKDILALKAPTKPASEFNETAAQSGDVASPLVSAEDAGHSHPEVNVPHIPDVPAVELMSQPIGDTRTLHYEVAMSAGTGRTHVHGGSPCTCGLSSIEEEQESPFELPPDILEGVVIDDQLSTRITQSITDRLAAAMHARTVSGENTGGPSQLSSVETVQPVPAPSDSPPHAKSAITELLDPTSATSNVQPTFHSALAQYLPTNVVARIKEPPSHFALLVHILEEQRVAGYTRVVTSYLGKMLTKENNRIYKLAGVGKLKDYLAAAERAEIILTYVDGVENGNRWVALRPEYHGSPRPRVESKL